MIYILLLIFVLSFLGSFYISRDIFSPSAIICESYIASTLCAIWNIKKWNINLHEDTVLILVLGLFIFLFVSFVIRNVYKKKNLIKKENNVNIDNLNLLIFNKANVMALTIMQFIILLIYLFFFFKTSNMINATSFEDRMYIYKMGKSYGHGESYDMPKFVSQLLKVSKAIAYVFLYIGIYNFILSKKESKKCKYVIPSAISAIIYSTIVILGGSRFNVITFFLSGIVMYYILDLKINNRKSIQFKLIIKIVALICLLVIFFSNIRGIVGRKNDSNLIDYVTSYFGGSIELFDLYMQNPIEKSNIFGKETFYGINKFLYDVGIIKESYSINLEFRSVNGIVIGNVYTAYRQMLQDFGIFGMIICQALIAIIMNKYYFKIMMKSVANEIDISLIFYCMIIYVLFFHSFYESLLSAVISVNFLITYFLLYVVKFILKKIKF